MKPIKFGPFEQRAALLAMLIFAGFIFFFGKLPDRIAAMENQRKYDGEFYEFAQMFSEIYGDIQTRYVHDVDRKKIFEAAVRGMFTALEDPHSQWLSPDSLSQLEKETEGEFSGVGLNITLQDDILTVIAPIPGTPAARAGILPMDRITKIDGVKTEGITLLEAVKKLTGVTGSEVSVEIFRQGAPELLNFKLVRDTIKVESVFHTVLEDDIGYIRIARFAETTADGVKKALEEFKKSPTPIKGLVVDLRYDSGGLLDKVVQICDFFLPKGQIVVSTKGRKEENNREFFAMNGPITDLPMVVLVNRGSASASEIFAGAMQDTKRGVIIAPKGQKTYGKGSVQTISYLKHSMERDENGEPKLSGLRLTTALYYTPSGRTIHNIGITPDYEVPVSLEDEIMLARHGLLGDPDTTKLAEAAEKKKEEEKKAEEKKEGESGDEKKEDAPQEKPADDGAKPAEGATEGEAKSAEPTVPKEFKDVLLEESLKYLRQNLIEKKQAKS